MASPSLLKSGEPESDMEGYLVDTNIWSALIRGNSPALLARFAQLKPQQLFMSTIVYGELQLKFQKNGRSPKRRQALDAVLAMTLPLSIDFQVATTYAQVRASLEGQAIHLDPNDTWIAAEALHHKLILVSDNGREFERVAGLKIENWL